jgi:phosphatidate cytidylyltransferase
VTRVLSALVLLPIVIGIIWFTPPVGTFILGGVVLALALYEYASLARPLSPGAPLLVASVAALVVYTAICVGLPVQDLLVAVMVGIALLAIARAKPEEDVLRLVAVSLLPSVYLATLLAVAMLVRATWGAPALLLAFLVIVISDSAQYYGGRTMGKRPLAPAISPKKTVEGAITGLIAAAIATPLLARFAFPTRGAAPFVLLGLLLAAVGMAGDLFESLVKRSVGVKDSSGLIPGHGGILDRIDALLFAGPVYYLFLRYTSW